MSPTASERALLAALHKQTLQQLELSKGMQQHIQALLNTSFRLSKEITGALELMRVNPSEGEAPVRSPVSCTAASQDIANQPATQKDASTSNTSYNAIFGARPCARPKDVVMALAATRSSDACPLPVTAPPASAQQTYQSGRVSVTCESGTVAVPAWGASPAVSSPFSPSPPLCSSAAVAAAAVVCYPADPRLRVFQSSSGSGGCGGCGGSGGSGGNGGNGGSGGSGGSGSSPLCSSGSGVSSAGSLSHLTAPALPASPCSSAGGPCRRPPSASTAAAAPISGGANLAAPLAAGGNRKRKAARSAQAAPRPPSKSARRSSATSSAAVEAAAAAAEGPCELAGVALMDPWALTPSYFSNPAVLNSLKALRAPTAATAAAAAAAAAAAGTGPAFLLAFPAPASPASSLPEPPAPAASGALAPFPLPFPVHAPATSGASAQSVMTAAAAAAVAEPPPRRVLQQMYGGGGGGGGGAPHQPQQPSTMKISDPAVDPISGAAQLLELGSGSSSSGIHSIQDDGGEVLELDSDSWEEVFQDLELELAAA